MTKSSKDNSEIILRKATLTNLICKHCLKTVPVNNVFIMIFKFCPVLQKHLNQITEWSEQEASFQLLE